MPTLNPLTWLVAALSLMVLVIGVDQVWLSALVLAVSLAAGVWGARSLAPALIAALLAAVANIRIDELVEALQVSRAGHRLAYILDAALQLLPQGTRTVQTVRDAHQLAGRRIGVTGAVPRLAVPVMTQLLTLGAGRGEWRWRPPASTCPADAPCWRPCPTHAPRDRAPSPSRRSRGGDRVAELDLQGVDLRAGTVTQNIGQSGSGLSRLAEQLRGSHLGAAVVIQDALAHITFLRRTIAE